MVEPRARAITSHLSHAAKHRCKHFVENLRSSPWWDVALFPEAELLERHADVVRSEFFDVVLGGQLRFHPQSLGGPRKTLSSGSWNIFELNSFGLPNGRNSLIAPRTSALLQSVETLAGHPKGLAYFSVLAPGAHVSPHCGPTNTRIRIHLGLVVHEGARMRVDSEWNEWAENRCIVFDDSFEHEVENNGSKPRSVLLVDTWHPELSSMQREAFKLQKPVERAIEHASKKMRSGWKTAISGGQDANQGIFEGAKQNLTVLSDARRYRFGATATALAERAADRSELLCAAATYAQSLLHAKIATDLKLPSQRFVPSEFDVLRSAFAAGLLSHSSIDIADAFHILSLYERSSATNAVAIDEAEANMSLEETRRFVNRVAATTTVGALLDCAKSYFDTRSNPFSCIVPFLIPKIRQLQLGG